MEEGGKGKGGMMGEGSTDGESPKKVLSLISRMSQIDPRMIRSRFDGIRSDDQSQRAEGPKITEEIRRSDGDPTRSEIREYLPVSSLDLVSRRAIPMHVEGSYRGRQLGPVTCKSRLGLVRRRREWMT